MLATGVFSYAAINTRVRAMYATLLTQQEWNDLINAPNYSGLISLLRRTVYGPYLSQVDETQLTPRRAVYQLQGQMADDFATIIRAAPERSCPLLTQLYRSFEVDNLKAVLRGIRSGASWEQVRYVLFPLGSVTVLPAQEMIQTGSVPAAIELLRGTPYYGVLSYAVRRYNVEQSLFPLEVALDLNYWRNIWEDIQKLHGEDRDQAMRILGSWLDVTNLMWAIRYRIYYNLSEEEIINYTLPFGYRVRDADIRAIASGAEISQIASRVYPNLPDVGALLTDARKGLPELEVKLLGYVMELCRKAFIGYPFQIGVPLAYLILKRMEIQDLTVLIEAKAANVPAEEFRPYLIVLNTPKNLSAS